MAEHPFEGTELIYSDPPYLKRTRTSRRRYRFDYEEGDHIALLELLEGVACQVMVSGYPSALYDERLAGWGSVELQVMNQGGVRTEKVWFNFVPDRVHWARYAGKNFTDRQRIKRKAHNWGRRYEALIGSVRPKTGDFAVVRCRRRVFSRRILRRVGIFSKKSSPSRAEKTASRDVGGLRATPKRPTSRVGYQNRIRPRLRGHQTSSTSSTRLANQTLSFSTLQ